MKPNKNESLTNSNEFYSILGKLKTKNEDLIKNSFNDNNINKPLVDTLKSEIYERLSKLENYA